MPEEERKFTAKELAEFNGQDGKPIYIAYSGRVIDVSGSRMWKGGQHMKRHAAGQDLTAEISAAPHGLEVLDRFPQVGVLAADEPVPTAAAGAPTAAHEELRAPTISDAPFRRSDESPLRRRVDAFLDRHPFFQRHPHPMTVHFPIVFFIFSPVFTLLYLATGLDGFDLTALNCLIAGLLFMLIVIPTGLFTWWVNYEAQPMTPVTIKIVLSVAMFVVGLAALIWRLADLQVLRHMEGWNILYLVLIILLLPMILVVAALGATLTFPMKKKGAEKPRA